MKKKLAALLAALAVLLTCVPSAAAAGSVYFTAVNDNVLDLTDATMPFWSGGYLYVASSVFSNREFGLSYSRNLTKRTVVFWVSSQPGRALIYNLSAGNVTDGEGNIYFPGAITRGDIVFLPVARMAEYFGLRYANMKVANGYLVRISNSGAALSDAVFADAAAYNLAYRYSQYQKAHETAQTPSSGGGDTPAVPGGQTTPETPAQSRGVYLCFLSAGAASTEQLLDVLDRSGAKGTVYFTRREIERSGDLLRRMAASGHSIGLAADAGAGGVGEQLSAANGALWEAVNTKTRLCVLIGEADSAVQEAARKDAEADGYCCLQPGLDRSGYGLRSASNAQYLLSRVAARRGSLSVWFGDGASATGLRAFLSGAPDTDRLLGLTELS